jgi:transcription initiation factor TFIID TATA-box-binding protein
MAALPTEVVDSIQVENVVTSSDLGCDLDLEPLSEDLSDSQYNFEQFPGLIYRTEEPRVTILVFRSGKVVCTGSRSYDWIEDALTQLLDEFNALGIDYTYPEMDIQNVVGMADLGSVLNLNAIAIGLGLENTEYEPEQFPGLVYRIEDLPTVGLLFGSGKVVVTGGKTTDDIRAGVEHIHAELDELALL